MYYDYYVDTSVLITGNNESIKDAFLICFPVFCVTVLGTSMVFWLVGDEIFLFCCEIWDGVEWLSFATFLMDKCHHCDMHVDVGVKIWNISNLMQDCLALWECTDRCLKGSVSIAWQFFGYLTSI